MLGERRTGINASVMDDVATVFKGKTLGQLSILEKSIQDKVKGGEGVDVGKYFVLLLSVVFLFNTMRRLGFREYLYCCYPKCMVIAE